MIVFTAKGMFFKVAKSFGYFCNKIWQQDFSIIAQFGHPVNRQTDVSFQPLQLIWSSSWLVPRPEWVFFASSQRLEHFIVIGTNHRHTIKVILRLCDIFMNAISCNDIFLLTLWSCRVVNQTAQVNLIVF